MKPESESAVSADSKDFKGPDFICSVKKSFIFKLKAQSLVVQYVI